jgi:hypothetical protein
MNPNNFFFLLFSNISFLFTDVGNNFFLPGVQLKFNNLKRSFGGGGFVSPTAETCQTECIARYPKNQLKV